jgi:two-component system LytT family sensor kinase
MKRLQNLVYRKPDFWTYQITGFLLFAIIDFFNSRIDSWIHFVIWLIAFALAFLLSFLLRPVNRYLYKRKPSFFSLLFLLIAISILFGTMWFTLRYIVYFTGFPSIAGTPREYFDQVPVKNILTTIYFNSVLFLGWSILYFGIKYRSDMISESERSEKALVYAQEAQLRMLRYQINPHFLFNSLNSIQALVYEDAQQADLMITELSEFLRYTLKYNDKTHVSLEMELEIIRKYLAIEKFRFEERLDYSIEATDDARSREILCFLLQPFVENAIKHGLHTSVQQKLIITICAYVENRWLCIEILNSGKWIPAENHQGTGIENVKQRLENGYHDRYHLDIGERNNVVYVILKISTER